MDMSVSGVPGATCATLKGDLSELQATDSCGQLLKVVCQTSCEKSEDRCPELNEPGARPMYGFKGDQYE